MTEVYGTRPYLESPIDVDETETLLQWVKYLGTTFGTGGALCALRYYEQLSWISPDARHDIEQYLQGLSLEELHSKKYDEPGHLTGPLTTLSGTPFGAHAKSLEFISALADDDLEGDMLRAKLAKHQIDAELTQPEDSSDDGVSPVETET
ncbi:MAG: archaellum component FlaD/FlaE [Natronomonas sp.]|jgi:archaellum component FlaD/FlaE